MEWKAEDRILVRRHWLKEDLRSGFTYGVGFFLVDRESMVDDSYFFDGVVTRVIIDKRGKEVPIIRLKPHEHEFRAYEYGHICECGYNESHKAPCPHRHCIVCGAETETQHIYEHIETRTETEPYYRKIAVYRCKGCGQRKEVIVEKCSMTKEELEIARRVASGLEPFAIEQESLVPEIWYELTQSHMPVETFDDLRRIVKPWVIEICREGEWRQAYCYVVPRKSVKKMTSFAFYGNIEVDLRYVYIRSLNRLQLDNEVTVKTFVPKRDWWRLYRPVVFTGRNFCIIPTEMDRIANDVREYFENAEEVLELLGRYAYLFDMDSYEALKRARDIDERLWLILSHVAVLEWTIEQMRNAPLPDIEWWDKD